MFAFFAIAAPSIAPPIPTITYGAIGGSGTSITATIDNYSSEYSYIATTNVGTLSRTGANITVTGLTIGTSVNIVVIATSQRGLSTPSSAVTDRQPYTYRTETRTGTRVVDTTSCYTASPGPTCPYGGVPNVAGTECCVPSSYTEEYTFTVEIKNNTPSGYLDSGYDWYRISNVSIERTPYTYYSYQETYTYSCQVSSTCCVDLPYQECTTTQVPSPGWCVGDCCQPNAAVGACVAGGNCPPYWVCNGGGRCQYWGLCGPLVNETTCVDRCCRQSCSPCTITSTCTGTRTVTARNPTPSGYTDSGYDWYRVL